MDCPKCRFTLPEPGPACPACGLVFARWRAATAARVLPESPPEGPPEGPPEVFDSEGLEPARFELDRSALRALAVGVPLGAAVAIVPLAAFFASYLSILVHELGHTLMAWSFAYPSLPAFDFVYGGGVTIHDARNPGILLLWYGAAAAVGWAWRRNRTTVVLLAVVCGLHLLAATTSAHEVLMLAAGHGGELVFAGIFLYRALGGIACRFEAERPLYAACATFMLVKLGGFAWSLATSAAFRAEYEEAKGGGGWMDLTQLARDHFGTEVSALAAVLFAATVAVPVLTVVAFRFQPQVEQALARLLRRGSAR